MTEALGLFTVDAAEGIILPAKGVEVITLPGPTYATDASRAAPSVSPIVTVRAFADPAAALTEAAAYYAAIGEVLTFRGLPCFVADVSVDHRAAHPSAAGAGAVVTATWSLIAPLTWVPV